MGSGLQPHLATPTGANRTWVEGNTYYMQFAYTQETVASSGQTTYTLNVPAGYGDYAADILLVAGGGGGRWGRFWRSAASSAADCLCVH